jgi:hypothetical protein
VGNLLGIRTNPMVNLKGVNVKKAEIEFGFVARTKFRERLIKTIQWYKNAMNLDI